MGVSDQAKNIIPLKFLGKIKNKKMFSLVNSIRGHTVYIREGKRLYPFLSKFSARRVVRFGIVKVYVEKDCRKIKFMYNIQTSPKKETNP
jgi:hypothetical protein